MIDWMIWMMIDTVQQSINLSGWLPTLAYSAYYLLFRPTAPHLPPCPSCACAWYCSYVPYSHLLHCTYHPERSGPFNDRQSTCHPNEKAQQERAGFPLNVVVSIFFLQLASLFKNWRHFRINILLSI